MHQFKCLLLFLLPFTLVSQEITGRVFDAETTIKGAKIFNKNKNNFTYTNEYGYFNINASVSDTLLFTSLFHEEKILKLTNNHFEGTLVVELKKIINNLDEVLLANEKREEFNNENYTQNLGLQMQNDIKNNPHLYGVMPQYGLDFVKIASIIGKLFKKKKTKETLVKPITHKALDSLFSTNKLFNKNLLLNDLKIPVDYNTLFFDYCEAQNMDNKLLLKKNEFIFLQELFNCSKDFLVILDDYKRNYLKD